MWRATWCRARRQRRGSVHRGPGRTTCPCVPVPAAACSRCVASAAPPDFPCSSTISSRRPHPRRIRPMGSRRPGGMAALFLAALLGCVTPEPEAPDVQPSWGPGAGAPEPLDALSRRFGRLRARMRDRGYREEARLGRGFLLEGESVDVPLDLVTDRCTTLVALAGGGMRTLEMALFDGEGVETSRSDVGNEGALVHVCPQVGRAGPPIAPYYLVLTAAEGSGAIA